MILLRLNLTGIDVVVLTPQMQMDDIVNSLEGLILRALRLNVIQAKYPMFSAFSVWRVPPRIPYFYTILPEVWPGNVQKYIQQCQPSYLSGY